MKGGYVIQDEFRNIVLSSILKKSIMGHFNLNEGRRIYHTFLMLSIYVTWNQKKNFWLHLIWSHWTTRPSQGLESLAGQWDQASGQVRAEVDFSF